jgi:hypothetical protein
MEDNIIPFRRRDLRPPDPDRRSQLCAHAAPAADGQGAFATDGRHLPPRVRKPRVPARDIELSRRLAATAFLPPERFLQSISGQGEAARRDALQREANLLARAMASNHRAFVLSPDGPVDIEAFYRRCHRLKTALDALAAELGRAALYNLGSFAVTFAPGQPSGWHTTRRGEERLRLDEAFGERDAIDLLRPRLRPAEVYEHEIFDVGHRNM